MRGKARLAIGLQAALLVTVLGIASPAAAATPRTSVTMASEPGDWVGAGTTRLFHSGNASITVSGKPDSDAGIVVRVDGASGDWFYFTFAAPKGTPLLPGVYARAQRSAFRGAGSPGIDVSGNGRGCNEIGGSFEVRELTTKPDGTVDRLWILYEQRCENGPYRLFGEVRINIPTHSTPAYPAPATVRWPEADLGRAGRWVPVTLVADDATGSFDVAVVGGDAGDFPIKSNECGGSLAGGASCRIWLAFSPTAAGARTSMLRIAEAGGRTQFVRLQGLAHGGRTDLTMSSDAGDWIGDGKQWAYTPANAFISPFEFTEDFLELRVAGDDGSDWRLDFKAPSGQILVPGTYTNALRYPFNGSGAGMSVTGNGRGCNELSGEFTITTIARNVHGELSGAGATFEQHCEHEIPALRGTIEWRADDPTQLPPWLVSGIAPSPPVLTTTPPSPANDNQPRVRGSAESGTVVELHDTPDCSGPSIAEATAAELDDPGIAIVVGDDTTTEIWAQATDAAGHVSPCSREPLVYVEDSTPPVPPLVTAATPDPGGALVLGSAEPGSNVAIYSDEACSGTVLASGSAAEFGSPGLAVSVAPGSATTFWAAATDAAGNRSSCSTTSATYVAPPPAPDPPVLTATDPPSPADDNSPLIIGASDPGSTVELYDQPTCSGPVRGSGTAAELAGSGIAVAVADNTTTRFWALAIDAEGDRSPCSTTSVTYEEVSIAPPPLPVPPQTRLRHHPRKRIATPVRHLAVKFAFDSSAAGARFRCLLRGRGVPKAVRRWHACRSPRWYRVRTSRRRAALRFRVKAVSLAGLVDATPAGFLFRVRRRG